MLYLVLGLVAELVILQLFSLVHSLVLFPYSYYFFSTACLKETANVVFLLLIKKHALGVMLMQDGFIILVLCVL